MKTLLIIITCQLISINLIGQDIQASLNSANSAYEAENTLVARENLKTALLNINTIIGNEILKLLPASLDGLDANNSEDNIIGNTGFAALFVTRTYGTSTTHKIEVTFTDNAPLLGVVNTFLSNDMIGGILASQTGQKQIEISGYKGMLEQNEGDDGSVNYDLNIPIDDTLLTFEAYGIKSEGEIIELAGQLNIDKIAALLK